MRFFSIILVCLVFLCGCNGNNENFFDYQQGEIELECTLVYDGHENGVKIKMSAPNESGERENICVEYTDPSLICGYTLEKSNGKYIGKMAGIEIPFGEKTAGVVRLLEQLFSLDEDMISAIEAADNSMTEATFIAEELSGKIVRDAEGNLKKLEASFSDGHSISLNIK